MKFRGLYIAAAVLAILTATLYWSNHHKPAEEPAKISADTPPVILKFDESSITSLDLRKRDAAPITLTRDNLGQWQITNPKPLRADQSAVSGMVSTLTSLNSERLVDDKATNLATYGLDQPALEVDLAEKGNKSQKLLIGNSTPTGSIYAALANDPRVFTIANYSKTSLDKGLNDLRDKRLLPVSAEKVNRIELVRENQDIEFGRTQDGWQILKPKPYRADGVEVSELVNKLTDAKMDLSSSDAGDVNAAFAKAAPVAIVRLTDETGTQELQVRKSKDTFYARSSAVEGTYKIAADIGKALDKNIDDFRNKKLFDFGYTDPNKIEVRNGSKAYFLARGTAGPGDWWSNGKRTDSTSVESLLSDLRSLSAAKFVDSGFSNPSIEILVTSDDGKRVEKVSLAKSGDHYVARRENDPSNYQMEASPVDEMLKAADSIKPGGKGMTM